MGKKLTIIVFGIVFGVLLLIGMAVGYYMALYNLDKTELLILGAFGFAFLTWVGSGVDLLGLLREWYKDKREAERTPTINQTGVFRTENPEAVHGEKYIESIYYLQVKLVSGDGMVNNCRASVTVQQTPLTYLCGTWRLSKYESISISKARPEYLELFRLREYEDDRARQFVFYSASSLTDDFIQSFDIAENVIMVTWGSENGNIPKPYTKIYEIMDESCVMNAQPRSAK